MLSSKILVVTTSSLDGIKIKQYLKPVSAHVVAGTNAFSDLAASFTDFFGGRSESYQKQLTSLYNEVVEKLKLAAYEIGANCIVGLKIDIDEVSGKNKSMFMITAVGTAVNIEEPQNSVNDKELKSKVISIQKLNDLNLIKKALKNAEAGKLLFNKENWDFFTTNRVAEILPYALQQYIKNSNTLPEGENEDFFKDLLRFVDSLPDKKDLLYKQLLSADNIDVTTLICNIIRQLNLTDTDYINQLLTSTDIQKQKLGVRIASYNKPFYKSEDITILNALKDLIQKSFPVRATLTTKKQLLSSKEKEVWACECGNTNDMDTYQDGHCEKCKSDIYGFKPYDMSLPKAIASIDLKLDLLKGAFN